MNNYKILHRKDAEYAYLVILYEDLQGSPRTTPSTFYAFRDETGSGIRKKDQIPTKVKNIHGSDVYESYLKRGWVDITDSVESYPWAIKSWLSQQQSQSDI